MATVTVNITRASIYAIAEGISITISQHNGGTPSYEQLWASQSESRKLDIYYREAVSDLERRIMKWVVESHAQYVLTENGTDYTLQLNMSPHWPTRLEGLLKNKIQDFIVHAVTAGWLNDFDGLTVKNDYQAMGIADLKDIREVIHMRSFGFAEAERTDDSDEKEEGEGGSSADRHDDSDEKEEGEGGSSADRHDDSNEKEEGEGGSSADRHDDRGKDTFVLPREAGARRKDDERKQGSDDRPPLASQPMDRHRDNDTVNCRTDYTDMSGTGIAYMSQSHGRPIRPGFARMPERMTHCHHKPTKRPAPQEKPFPYPEPPTHAIPSKPMAGEKREIPVPNGIGWSDDARYDKQEEERFVDSHDCGHHDCGHHGKDELDWDFDNDEDNQ